MQQEKQVKGLKLGKNHITSEHIQDDIFQNRRTTVLTDFNSEINITTDSLVAKVKVKAKNSTKRLWIFWGDFESDSISVNYGINYAHSPEFGLPISIPESIYEVLHVYDRQKDSSEFKKNITIRIQDHSGSIHQYSKTIRISSLF